MKKLTGDDIIEITGTTNLRALENLEILFSTYDEIDSLEECCNLKRIAMINNGLKLISNLSPVSTTLISLCLCDQSIVEMMNLDLPFLVDLFLHRNRISVIAGLSGCPRLKRLWLSQNKIRKISSLHAVPELVELNLQSNEITNLDGLNVCSRLSNLGLAGNLISDFNELMKIQTMSNLREVTFLDIHFGRCPIVDFPGYKDFVLCYLSHVRLLDGVTLSRDLHSQGEDFFTQQVLNYEEELGQIENEYRCEIQRVDSQIKSRESHAQVLEKEMTGALNELQGLVSEGRDMMKKQISKQSHLLTSSYSTLEMNLISASSSIQAVLSSHSLHSMHKLDLALSYFCHLESVAVADAIVSEHLVHHCSRLMSSSHSQYPFALKCFQLIGSNSPEFLLFHNTVSFDQSPGWELTRLYRLVTTNVLEHIPATHASESPLLDLCSSGSSLLQVHTFVSEEELTTLFSFGKESGTVFFCTEPALCMPGTKAMNFDFINHIGGLEKLTKLTDMESKNCLRDLPRLQSALQSKIFLLLSCWIDISTLQLSIEQSRSRSEFIENFQHSSRPAACLISNESHQRKSVPSYMIVLPTSELCHVRFEFLSIYLSPTTSTPGEREVGSDCGFRSLEAKLELLLLPNEKDKVSLALKSFEEEVNASVNIFVDKLLEEVTDVEVAMLREANSTILKQESALRGIRENIESERRVQDSMLRDIRVQVAADSSAKSKRK